MATNYSYVAATAAAVSPSSSSTASTIPTDSSFESTRPYLGKCQYKTGKCFNERTLKRNGDAHSLCEEHRVKQNLIQRRSDRKYQTVHAIRRRERSQRRAALKKQASMAAAQQLFYEHQQQQQSIGTQQLGTTDHHSVPGHGLLPSTSLPLHPPQHHNPNYSSLSSHNGHRLSRALNPVTSLAPPIQIPDKMDLSRFVSASPAAFQSSGEGLASPILSLASAARSFDATAEASERDVKMEDEGDSDDGKEDDSGEEDAKDAESKSASMLQQRRKKQVQQRAVSSRSAASSSVVKDQDSSPTGIDDFAPDSFLTICASYEESDAAYANLVPIMSSMGEKEMWTEDDIEFLQSVLLS